MQSKAGEPDVQAVEPDEPMQERSLVIILYSFLRKMFAGGLLG